MSAAKWQISGLPCLRFKLLRAGPVDAKLSTGQAPYTEKDGKGDEVVGNQPA